MMVFVPPPRHRGVPGGPQPTPPLIAAAIAAAVVAVGASMAVLGAPPGRGPSPGVRMAVIGLVAALGIAAAVFAIMRSRSDEGSGDSATRSDDASSREEQSPVVRLIVASIAAVVAMVLVFLLASARTVNGQELRNGAATTGRPAQAQAQQFAHLLIRGSDTIIVERVTQTRDSIVGEISARGAPRIAYVAALGPGPSAPLLTFRVFGPGSATDALPLQSGSLLIRSDSAIIEAAPTGGASQRAAVAITGSPLPLINGSMALANLMLDRARASTVRPYRDKFHFIQGAGVPLDATVDSLRGDSVVFWLNNQVHRFALDAEGHVRGGSIPSQGIIIARVSGAAAAKVSLGRPDYGAPPGAPYTAEEVTVPAPKGHTLSGTLTIPKGATGRVPAVVTITGSGQQDRDEFLPMVSNYRPFRQLADTLGRRGIAVLRLDDRGINGSGGDVASATSADFADDIRAGVAFLRARPDVDPARIALFGHSEGGAIGPMVAATDAKLAGVVLFAGPAYNGRRIIEFQLRNLVSGDSTIPAAKKDSTARAQIAQFDSTAGKAPWMRFFVDYDPLATLRKVRVPVLILQGGTDQQVTPDQAPIIEQTLKAAGNRDVTMRVFAERNHLFLNDPVGFPRDYGKIKDGHIGPDVMGPLADWLVLKLSAARPQR